MASPINTSKLNRDEYSQISGNVTHVSDETILDHADAAVTGSIAFALAQAAALPNGGTVTLGAGVYNITSAALVVGWRVKLIGRGKGKTFIVQAHATANGIELNSGTDSVGCHGEIADLHVAMPKTTSAGDAFVALTIRGAISKLHGIAFTGGGVNSWGITIDSCNNVKLNDISTSGLNPSTKVNEATLSNGIRFIATSGASVNYGDTTVTEVDGGLATPNTIGLQFVGSATSSINNIAVLHMSCRGTTGCTMVQFGLNATRNTVIHPESENSLNMVEFVGTNSYNVIINPIQVGTTNAVVGTVGTNQFIGGTSEFRQFQFHVPKTSVIVPEPTDITVDANTHGANVITNLGATGTTRYDLPAPSNTGTTEYTFAVVTAQLIEIFSGGTRRIIPPGSGVPSLGAGKRVTTTTDIGQTITLRNISNQYWMVVSETGNWSV